MITKGIGTVNPGRKFRGKAKNDTEAKDTFDSKQIANFPCEWRD